MADPTSSLPAQAGAPEPARLAGDSTKWATKEAMTLQGLLEGGVDQWAALESKLLVAQESMARKLDAYDDSYVSRTPSDSEYESDGSLHSPSDSYNNYSYTASPVKHRSRTNSGVASPHSPSSPSSRKRSHRRPVLKPLSEEPSGSKITLDEVGPGPDRTEDRPTPSSAGADAKSPSSKTSDSERRLAADKARFRMLNAEVAKVIRAEVTKANEERAAMGQELNRVKGVNSELAATVQSLRSQLSVESERYQVLQSLLNKATSSENEAKVEVKQLQQMISKQQEVISAKESELRTLAARLQDQQAGLVDKEKQFNARELKLAEAQQAVALKMITLEREKDALNSELMRHVESSASAKAQLQQKILLLSELEGKLQNIDREKLALQAEVVRQVQTVEDLKQRLQTRAKELADSRTETLIAKERVAILESQTEALQLSAASMQRAAEKSKMAVEMKLEAMLGRFSSDRNLVQDDRSYQLIQMQSALAAEQDKYKALQTTTQSEVDSLRSKLQSTNEELKTKVSEFRNKITEVQNEKRSIERKVKTLEEEKRRLHEESNSHRLQAEKLEILLEDTQINVTALKKEISSLRTQVSDLQHDRSLLHAEAASMQAQLDQAERDKSSLREAAQRAEAEKRAIADTLEMVNNLYQQDLETNGELRADGSLFGSGSAGQMEGPDYAVGASSSMQPVVVLSNYEKEGPEMMQKPIPTVYGEPTPANSGRGCCSSRDGRGCSTCVVM